MIELPGQTDAARLRACCRLMELRRLKHNQTTAAILADGKPNGMARVRAFQRFWEAKDSLLLPEMIRLRAAVIGPEKPVELGGKMLWAKFKAAGKADAALDAGIGSNHLLLAVGETAGADVDPTEDFTTYTEVDPNSHLSKTASTITVAGITNGEDAYIYADKGVGHFTNAFTHLVDTRFTAGSAQWAQFAFWAISNDVDDMGGWNAGNHEAACLRWQDRRSYDGKVYAKLGSFERELAEDWDRLTFDTPYYAKLVRSGANGQTLTAYEYSDAIRATLVAQQAVALFNNRTFQYVFGCNSWNLGGSLDMADLERKMRAAAGRLYLVTVNDAMGVTDDASRIAAMLRVLTEAMGLADAASIISTIERVISDVIALADSVTASAAYLRTLTDSVGLTDDMQRVLAFVRTQDETVGLVDSLARLVEYVRTHGDGIGVTDSVLTQHISGVSLAAIFLLLKKHRGE